MNRTQALATFIISKETIGETLSEVTEAIDYATQILTYGPNLARWKINPLFIQEIYRCASCGFKTNNRTRWCPECDSFMAGTD